MKLKGQVAIITGAGRGIGRAIALAFAEQGGTLVLCGKSPESIEEASHIVKQSGADPLSLIVDVAVWDQVTAMCEKVLERFGKIDILINNAGIVLYKSVLDTTEQDWNRLIDTNMKGVFLCCKAVLPSMLKAKAGVIVNVSSILGLKATANMSVYSASKFGIIGFTQSLAAETLSEGVRVYSVCPGPTNTALHQSVVGHEAASKAMPPQRVANKILAVVAGEISKPSGAEIVIDEQDSSSASALQEQTCMGHCLKSLELFLRRRVKLMKGFYR
jgi:3-oxoacyl-[acyl-carrier protein] reductase